MSQKIPWPVDGQPANFSDIAAHILTAINALYTLTPKPFKRNIPFQIPSTFGEPAKSTISRSDIEYAEEQGREAIHIIISGAVRLGAHQQYCYDSVTRLTYKATIMCVKLLLEKGDGDSIKDAISLLEKFKSQAD